MSEFTHISIDTLELDTRNPRIARWMEIYKGEISAEQMSLALGAGDSLSDGDGTTFNSLKESIRTNGGVIHPIIVNKESSGRLVVIEGNTRTLIYREFRDQNVDGEWDTIPAMVYDNLGEAQVDAIRLQAHLVGPRAWDPYSKAKYLEYLRNCEHLTYSQIVDFCGGRKREVNDYINAFNDMESYYRPILESDDEFDPSRFSSFVELQRPRVKQSLLDAGFDYSTFSKWVHEGLLSPQSTVRDLPRILANPESREVFLNEGANSALTILAIPGSDNALAEATMAQLAKELTSRILNMSYAELQRLRSDLATEENDALCGVRDHLQQLCRDIASDEFE